MRIGIISDIHSNLDALETVLDTMKHLKIDRYVCLGDLVGYGANPNEVVDIIRPLADFSIMGNHDAAVAGKMDYQYYYDSAREALTWTKEQLSDENMKYLQDMKYIVNEDSICFTHGEPFKPELFNYIYLIEHTYELVANYDSLRHITFVGHSHLRRVFELSSDIAVELPDNNFTLRDDRKYAVAVGSVGQPRDYDPRCSFVIYDTEPRRVEFYRLEYNVDNAAERIINAGLPEYFATRLYSGS